jgi:hypothetical protein
MNNIKSFKSTCILQNIGGILGEHQMKETLTDILKEKGFPDRYDNAQLLNPPRSPEFWKNARDVMNPVLKEYIQKNGPQLQTNVMKELEQSFGYELYDHHSMFQSNNKHYKSICIKELIELYNFEPDEFSLGSSSVFDVIFYKNKKQLNSYVKEHFEIKHIKRLVMRQCNLAHCSHDKN